MKKYLLLLLTIFALNSCEQDPEIIGVNAEKKLPKVEVCHYDADTDTWKTISINGSALKAHLGHGDYEGKCCDTKTFVPDDVFEQLLIDLGYDDELDDYVCTKNIEEVTELIIPEPWKLEEGNFQKSTMRKSGKIEISTSSIEIYDKYLPSNKILANKIFNNETIKNFNLFNSYSKSNIELKNSSVVEMQPNTIYDLTGIQDFKALIYLEIRFHQIKSLDFTGNIQLSELIVYDQSLKSINLLSNINLKKLSLVHGIFENIDLTYNTNLIFLNISNQVLDNLDLNKNNQLETLRLYLRNANSLDFTKNINLKELSLDAPLETIDLSKTILLERFNFQLAKWTSLDLSKNINLRELGFHRSLLKTLDLSKNLALEYLFTVDNKDLTTIDLSKNLTLEELILWDTHLTGIDLSQNNSLTRLLISFAPSSFINLDISNNTLLEEMHLYKVPLTSLDITKNINLKDLSIYGGMSVSFLDFTKNTELEYLNLDSSLNSIDLSKNTKLWKLTMDGTNVYSLNLNNNSALINFYCKNNINLNQLFFKNNNYLNVTHFSVRFNSNLTCIEVDNPVYSTANWSKDSWTDFREDCGY